MPGSERLPRWLAIPYTAWAASCFLVLSLGILLFILPVPSLPLRRRMVHRAARLVLQLCGFRLTVRHRNHLPHPPVVVVANHASFLDGVVLFAALPPVFAYVIKREMRRMPLAGLLLQRIGSQFVDRGGASQGRRDTRAIMKRALNGSALAFFPEGTFHHKPGLMRFRSGAFVVAANAGLPVVPVAIRGTRRALPPGSALACPGAIEVEIAPALPAPRSSDVADIAPALRAARVAILERIPDPDAAPDN